MNICSVCKEEDSDIYLCDVCQSTQCQKCTNLTVSEIRAVAIKKRQIMFLCDCCKMKIENLNVDTPNKLLNEVICKLNDIQEEVKNQKHIIAKQGELIEKQGQLIETLTTAINSKNKEIKSDINKVIKTQEDIAETYAGKTKKKIVEPVILIKPKDSTQKNDDTRKEVKNYIDPTKMAVSGMKNSRDGGVIIECKNKAAADTLKAEAQNKLGQKYNVIEPKTQLPKIKIVGITETNSPEEIEELLYVQNEDILDRQKSNIKVVHVTQNKKNKRSYVAYIQLDGDSYNKILKAAKINIGWDRCAVYDAVDIAMCFNCCGFNLAKNCSKQMICAKCGGEHSTNTCEAVDNEATCVNCKHAVEKLKIKNIDYHHNTWSKDCPAYIRNLEIKRSRINFL